MSVSSILATVLFIVESFFISVMAQSVDCWMLVLRLMMLVSIASVSLFIVTAMSPVFLLRQPTKPHLSLSSMKGLLPMLLLGKFVDTVTPSTTSSLFFLQHLVCLGSDTFGPQNGACYQSFRQEDGVLFDLDVNYDDEEPFLDGVDRY